MDHGDGSVCFVDAAEQWQGDGVVTSQGDDARKRLSRLADARFISCSEWNTGEKGIVPVLDLLEGIVVVVSVG